MRILKWHFEFALKKRIKHLHCGFICILNLHLFVLMVQDFNAYFQMHFEYALKKCTENILIEFSPASQIARSFRSY